MIAAAASQVVVTPYSGDPHTEAQQLKFGFLGLSGVAGVLYSAILKCRFILINSSMYTRLNSGAFWEKVALRIGMEIQFELRIFFL